MTHHWHSTIAATDRLRQIGYKTELQYRYDILFSLHKASLNKFVACKVFLLDRYCFFIYTIKA